MKRFYVLFYLVFANSIFAQTSDSIDYKNELQLLKNKLEILEERVSKQDSATNKKFGLLDRTKFSFFSLMRIGELDWNQEVFNVATGKPEHLNPRFWTRPLFFLYLDSKLSKDFDFRFSMQNYPYSVFGGETDERLAILLGEIWLNYKINKNISLKFGRQDASNIWDNQIGTQFDFWQHDGLSLRTEHNLNQNLSLTTKSAFFIERYINNAPIKEHGKLYGISANLTSNKNNKSATFSTGFIRAEKLPNTYYSSLGQFLYDGDLAPEYSVFLAQGGITFRNLDNLTLKADFFYNLKNYKQNPNSTFIRDLNGKNSFDEGFNPNEAPDFTKQRTGFFGEISADLPFISKNLNVAGGYLYMQKYAALDFFAQYDLARWASTNVKGPQFVVKYKLNDRITFRNRTFFIEEIKGLNAVDPDFVRKGNRTRFDIIINF